MASYFLSPIGNDAPFFLSTGVAASGYKLFTYTAGSSTKQNTYQDNAGATPNANPILLNSSGYPASGGSLVEIWLTSGVNYKFILAPSTDTDPPTNAVWTRDNITAINDVGAVTGVEWLAGPAPTYVSATQFTLVGDQTGTFTVGRRVKTTNSGGTVYSIITVSAFTSLTTVTVVNDASTLDSGLSAVSYALLAADNQSSPPKDDVYPIAQNHTDRTKRLALSLSGLTTGVIRTATVPDNNFNLGMARSYLAGLTMSTAGASATMTIAAGAARDSTNVADIVLAASIAKTTGAWTVGTGNGGLDTGAIANTTWYHFWVIMRPDTQVVDVLLSLSATAPTMPANYTYKRRIGAGITNGSAQWTSFIQDGDLFQLLAPTQDVGTTNPGTSAVTATLTVPLGVNVLAKGIWNLHNTDASNAAAVYVSDLATTDTAASQTIAQLAQVQNASGRTQDANADLVIRTNTSSQVRYRASFSNGSVSVTVNTTGWIDRRGRDT